MEALKTKDPLTISAPIYDVVCNGYELGTGAVRNHQPEVMYEAFRIAGYDKATVDEKFPALIKAFQYGAPPHGGLALGIERIIMLLAGEEAIREVIPFPLSQTVEDLMMGAPSTVSAKQLKEAHIKLDLPK
jgi:aspartyl-tRNA synthetase